MKTPTLFFFILFWVSAYSQPVNDVCSNATDLGTLLNLQNLNIDLNTATESLDASCETASNQNLDLWFSFAMPFDGRLRITGVSGANRISLFSACGGTEVYCQSGNGSVATLLGGNTYFLRYAAVSTGLLTDNFSIQAFAPPPNDSCNNAILIPNLTNAQAISLDTRGANQDLVASCENVLNDNLDLWYQFVMPFDGQVRITGLSVVDKTVVYASCGGLEISCASGQAYHVNLDSGSVYLLRFANSSQFAGADNFTIQAFPKPVNDACAAALPISVQSTAQAIQSDNRGANQSILLSCESGSTDHYDLWYQFVMPFDGKIKLSGLSVVFKTGLFDQCGGTELACLVGTGFIESLSGGQTYFLRIGSGNLHAAPIQWSIQAFAPPVNDSCPDAIQISQISIQQQIALDTRGAAESLDASCETAANENLDLWYSFTMPFSGQLEVSGVFGVNKVSLYDSCGGNELDCLSGGGFFYGLIGGNTYWLRYAAVELQANPDDFFIQAFPFTTNDECIDAIDLGLLNSLTLISLDTREATESLNANCEDPSKTHLDLWYRLDMPFDGKIVAKGVFGVNRIVLFDSCGGAELGCLLGNGAFYQLDSGHQYLLRYAALAGSANPDEFSIEAFPYADNDECQSAFEITQPDSLQYILADPRDASESLDASCDNGSLDNLDLWYWFTMPGNGNIQISESNNAHHISLMDSCNGAEIACLIGEGEFVDLDSGKTYWLRYASALNSASADSFLMGYQSAVSIEKDTENHVPVSVYPNPTPHTLHLKGIDLQSANWQLEILDLKGRQMMRIPKLSDTHLPLSVRNIPNGLYLLRLTNQHESFTTNFLKHE
ncbi:MAG: T9SS type A sorting domain-containing protein [Bacteroidota bacterium]